MTTHPDTMKAVVLEKPRTVRVRDVPLPPLAPDEVLVKVAHCGVCGSDVRYYKGENPWSSHTEGVHRDNPPGIILGHEFAGRVVAAGSAKGEALVGKDVAVLPYRVCGTCDDCRQGNHNLCRHMIHHGHGAGWGEREFYPGGMAEYCPAWVEKCHVVAGSLPLEEAALTDFVGVALHAVGVSGFTPCRLAVVVGVGPVGCSAAQIARARGAENVLVVDRSRFALEVCIDLGFEHLALAGRDDVDALVAELSKGRGADFIFDTVCSDETQTAALPSLANRGSLVDIAVSDVRLDFPLTALAGERQLRTSSNYLEPEFGAALDMIASGKVEVAPMITHRWRIDEAAEVFEQHVDKEEHRIFKSVLEFP